MDSRHAITFKTDSSSTMIDARYFVPGYSQAMLELNTNLENLEKEVERKEKTIQEMLELVRELRASEDQNQTDCQKGFCCPISLEVMSDPVVAPDGHTYERSNIKEWLSSHTNSPMTGSAMPIPVNFIPNRTLKSMIASNGYQVSPESSDEPKETRKARGRKCPAAKAKSREVGTIETGLDGEPWIVVRRTMRLRTGDTTTYKSWKRFQEGDLEAI